jgi:hypothetical protein
MVSVYSYEIDGKIRNISEIHPEKLVIRKNCGLCPESLGLLFCLISPFFAFLRNDDNIDLDIEGILNTSRHQEKIIID